MELIKVGNEFHLPMNGTTITARETIDNITLSLFSDLVEYCNCQPDKEKQIEMKCKVLETISQAMRDTK